MRADSERKFAAPSFPRKDGGLLLRTIRRSNFASWPTFPRTSASPKHFPPEKISIAGPRQRCSGLPIEEVTPPQRGRAKAVNFGIVYGQTPFGLAQQLGISPDEAADFISRYFEQYQGVQRYIENCLSQARDTGVTRTLFGRIRQHPEINSRNGMRRRHGGANRYQFAHSRYRRRHY